MNKILVIAPHPDDEILGCGATIAKHVNNNDIVTILVITNASVGAPEIYSKEQVEITRNEALNAHKYLGVENTIFLDFPAPMLNAFPEYKISKKISEVIDDFQPNILYLPYGGDLHQDHKAIYRAALVSARPQNSCSVKKILCYETLSETEWAPLLDKPFIPNYYIDVSQFFDLKISSLKYFKSQLKEAPHSRSIEAVSALATFRGASVGFNKAEAFTVERILI